jgi:hypothetical protein
MDLAYSPPPVILLLLKIDGMASLVSHMILTAYVHT